MQPIKLVYKIEEITCPEVGREYKEGMWHDRESLIEHLRSKWNCRECDSHLPGNFIFEGEDVFCSVSCLCIWYFTIKWYNVD